MADAMVEKWGKRVAERGFAQIPNYLMELNRFVDEEHKLNATETITLLHLVSSWWKKDEMPFPSMRTLSDRSGVSERQIQRALKSLEGKGYFKKLRKQVKTVISSNVYDLMPLVKILDEVAEHYGNAHPRQVRSSSIPGNGQVTGQATPARRRMVIRKGPGAESLDSEPASTPNARMPT